MATAAIGGDFVRRESPKRLDVCCGGFPPSGTDELHVLAVDDSNADRKVIERLLKISSCKVTAVESARRALQYLETGFEGLKVNLIMTDYSMPGMTGYELLKKIKESSTLKEIPVVIMSSENVLARIDRCLEEGAEEFLVKPIKLADVKRLKDFILRGGEAEEKGEKRRRKQREESPPPLLPSVGCAQPPSSPLTLASSSALSLQSVSKRPRLCTID